MKLVVALGLVLLLGATAKRNSKKKATEEDFEEFQSKFKKNYKNKEEKDTEEEKAAKAHEALMAEKNKMKEDAKAAKSETEDALSNL